MFVFTVNRASLRCVGTVRKNTGVVWGDRQHADHGSLRGRWGAARVAAGRAPLKVTAASCCFSYIMHYFIYEVTSLIVNLLIKLVLSLSSVRKVKNFALGS